MARRRKRRTLRPHVAERVKKGKRGAKMAEGHQHPELIGLGLLALGVFLGFVVWADWNGGSLRLLIGGGRARPVRRRARPHARSGRARLGRPPPRSRWGAR